MLKCVVTLSVLLFSGRCINSEIRLVVWGGVGGGYERDIMVYEGALYVPRSGDFASF